MTRYVEVDGLPMSRTMVGKGPTRRPWGTRIIGTEKVMGDSDKAIVVANEPLLKARRDPRDPRKGGRPIRLVPPSPIVRELMGIVTAVRLKIPLSVRGRGILYGYMNNHIEGN